MRNVVLFWIGARGLRWLAGAIVVAMLIGAASAHAQLVIRICGTAAAPCQSDAEDLNADTAKVFADKAVAGSPATSVEVKNAQESERVPTTAAVPVPAPTGAPQTVAATSTTEYEYNGWHQSLASACDAYAAYQDANWVQGTVTVTSSGGGACVVNFHHTANNTDTPSTYYPNTRVVSGCPSGYIADAGGCTKNDDRAATPDAKLDFVRTGDVMSAPAATDADTSLFLDNDSIGKMVGGSYQRSGYAPNGAPVHVEIAPVAGGGSKLIYTESKDGLVRQTTIAIGPAGTVASKVSGVAAGDLLPAPLDGTAAISSAPGVATPGSGGGTASGLGDYAKAGEAAAAGSGIEGKLDTLHDDLTGDGAGTDLAAEKQAYEDAADAHKGLLDGLGGKGQSDEGGLLTWLLPNPVAQDNTCIDPSVTIASGLPSEKTVTITGYCDTAGKVRALLGWVLYILTSYGLFAIATGRHTA